MRTVRAVVFEALSIFEKTMARFRNPFCRFFEAADVTFLRYF